MIKSIRFKNFFSFRDCKIDLHSRENILIGINGSGKSNLLKALKLLEEGVGGIGLRKLIYDKWGGFDNIYFCGIQNDNDENYIMIEYQLDKGVISKFGFNFRSDIFYQIRIYRIKNTSNYYLSEKIYHLQTDNKQGIYLESNNGNGIIFDHQEKKELVYETDRYELSINQLIGTDKFYPLLSIKKAIKQISVYDYFDTTPYSKMRKPMLPTSEARLLPDGSNLPQILNTLKINDKQNFKKILDELNDINEHYNGIDFNFIGGNIELMLEEEGLKKSVHVTHISDGTLRFLCLLAICYNQKRGKIVCIDEPEVGLHPDMLLSITNAIQKFSEDTQFIIATHSENVLNNFGLENVRVFEKNENNETIVNQYSEKDFEGWYEDFFPGKMWRQGDFGGNRW